MKYTWETSPDAEGWYNGLYDTVDECIEAARKELEGKGIDVIYIGEAIIFEPYVDAKDIFDRLEEQAYNDCGEFAKGWRICNYSKNEDIQKLNELSDKLTDIVNNWLKKYKKEPDFYNNLFYPIVNIKEYGLN